MFTYGIIFLFSIVLGIVILYIANIYIVPKKIGEIAKMIDSGQSKLAIKKLSEILEKDDRNPYAHFLLSKAYMLEGNTQYAILESRQVLKLGRFDDRIKEAVVRKNLIKLYKSKKMSEEAKKELLIMTKVEPENYENYYDLGVLFYNAGVMDKAIGFFKKSYSSNSKHEMSVYYLGQIYYKSQNYVDAKQMFINSIKLNSQNYKSHYFLGLVLRQQGDFEWAIKEFETAQKDDELKVKCFLAKGSCYMEKGQLPKSVSEFQRGLKYVKKSSDTELNLRYFLAECHEKMRDIHQAIYNWEKITEINQKFRDVNDKLIKYAEFRQDDRIKDFMIAGLSQFEQICKRIIATMGFNTLDIEIIDDTQIEIIAIEVEGKWRNTRQSNRIIRILRITESIQVNYLRKLHETMKAKNATRILIITTGEFSQKAIEFANTRPIEILGKAELISLLKKAEK